LLSVLARSSVVLALDDGLKLFVPSVWARFAWTMVPAPSLVAGEPLKPM
jgi:hypothetical protein